MIDNKFIYIRDSYDDILFEPFNDIDYNYIL